jgi:hypothetical protein
MGVGNRARCAGARILPVVGRGFKTHWPGAAVSRSRSHDRARFSAVVKAMAKMKRRAGIPPDCNRHSFAPERDNSGL